MPPPTWVTSGMRRSAHADQNGSQWRRLYSGARRHASREVHALAVRRHAPTAPRNRRVEIPQREVGKPDVAVGCLRDEVGEPAVVDRWPTPSQLRLRILRRLAERRAARTGSAPCSCSRGRSRRRRRRRGRSQPDGRRSRGGRRCGSSGGRDIRCPRASSSQPPGRPGALGETVEVVQVTSRGSSRTGPRRGAGRCACRSRR